MVLELSDNDIIGRAFNGYDLHLGLIKRGIEAKQIVMNKQSDSDSVIRLEHDEIERDEIECIERKGCISNILFPYADDLLRCPEFKHANILHYHLIYHRMFSILDYARIMDSRSVWTLHDPWIVTGNCTHPLDCNKWLTGCDNCARLNDDYFPMNKDNTKFMWNEKKDCLSNVNPHIIVSTNFMKRYIEKCPITAHFSNVHVIPFGIDIKNYKRSQNYRTNEVKVKIGFRADNTYIKGCSILYDSLRRIKNKERIILVSVGNGMLPEDLKNVYETQEYGWVNDNNKMVDFFNECDLFVIPSLAESFCLMAIEAMAAGCAVICFKNTVVAEVTNAPECACIAEYGDCESLAKTIELLIQNREYRKKIGSLGEKYVERYSFEKYLDAHINLYREITSHL